MMEKITRRFWWKVLSVVLAFFLWLIVVNYDDPLITREFSVPVKKVKTEEITSQNKHIEYLEGEYVEVVIRGKRSVVDIMTPNDILAYADLSKVSVTGAVDIEVQVEGVSVISKKPSDMLISMEDIKTVQLEVQYYFDGLPAENYVALKPTLTPNRIELTGPESKISMVSSVIVSVKINDAKEDLSLTLRPEIRDSSNKEVSGVYSNISFVQVAVPIQLTKTIPIVFKPMDEVADGYRLTHSELDLKEVIVRGKEEALATMNQILINDISMAGRNANETIPIDLQARLLPGVYLYSDLAKANLQLFIEPLVEKEITIMPQDIMVKNIPEGYKFSYLDDQTPIILRVSGIQAVIDTIDADSLQPNIRLFGLEEGEHQIQMNYNLPNGVELITDPPLVDVTLKLDTIVEDTNP